MAHATRTGDGSLAQGERVIEPDPMMSYPRIGQLVQVWYAEDRLPMPLHGRIGTVVVRSRGKPRNHGVEIDGALFVVPCGNLRSVTP